MAAEIDVYWSGNDSSATWAAAAGDGCRFHQIADGTAWTDAARLCELVESSAGEFVALVHHPTGDPLPALERLREPAGGHVDVDVVVAPFTGDPFAAWIWAELPATLSALVRPISPRNGVLLRKSAIAARGGFRDVSEPVWDLVIRAAAASPAAVVASEVALSASDGNDELPDLAPAEPGAARDWLHQHLRGFQPTTPALTAGLLQLHDYLDESHSCSQSIEGNRWGDHWHGIMHRREPDYSNAKYWYRRVGPSPIFGELAQRASGVLSACRDSRAAGYTDSLGVPGDWDAFAFVDMCQTAARKGAPEIETAARQIQFWEMLLLLQSTHAVMTS